MLALALGGLALLPALVLLGQALPVLGQGGWLAHFASTTLPHQALASLAVAAEAVAVALAAGAVPAVAVARYEFSGRRVVTALVLLPLLLSPSVAATTWTVVYAHEFFVSGHALALQHGLSASPYVFVIFRVAATRMPRAFGELAASLGLGILGRIWRVHLPLLAVPAAASAVIVGALAVGDYAAAERLGVPTLSVGILNLWLSTQSVTVAAIVSTVVAVPAVLAVAVAAWAATSLMSQNPVTAAAAAAGRRRIAPLWGAGIVAWTLLAAMPGFFAPEAQLVRWAIERWSRTRFEAIPGDVANTLVTALGTTALVALAIALVVLVMRSGHRSRWAERLPWLFLTNFFLPTLVLALAFVMMTSDASWLGRWLGDWRDTRWMIAVPEALRLMPFAMLPVLDAMRRTPPAMVEAARAFGAGPVAARLTAYAGHVAPAWLLGCALVFMEAIKALDAALTLQPFGFSSLALKIYAFSRHQNMDRAAIWVLLSQALMLLPWLLLWWRLDRLDARRGPA